MDCPGILTNTVQDAALVLQAIVAPDPRDSTCIAKSQIDEGILDRYYIVWLSKMFSIGRLALVNNDNNEFFKANACLVIGYYVFRGSLCLADYPWLTTIIHRGMKLPPLLALIYSFLARRSSMLNIIYELSQANACIVCITIA